MSDGVRAGIRVQPAAVSAGGSATDLQGRGAIARRPARRAGASPRVWPSSTTPVLPAHSGRFPVWNMHLLPTRDTFLLGSAQASPPPGGQVSAVSPCEPRQTPCENHPHIHRTTEAPGPCLLLRPQSLAGDGPGVHSPGGRLHLPRVRALRYHLGLCTPGEQALRLLGGLQAAAALLPGKQEGFRPACGRIRAFASFGDRCKPRITGRQCDRCASGSYRFPECVPCRCNRDGTKRGVCDPDTGACLCKVRRNGQVPGTSARQ